MISYTLANVDEGQTHYTKGRGSEEEDPKVLDSLSEFESELWEENINTNNFLVPLWWQWY